jgi:DNA-binding NarL/FixJ family response regulator
MTKEVIIIENDIVLAEAMKDSVNSLEGYSCNLIFVNVSDFLASKSKGDILLLDLMLSGENGLDFISRIALQYPDMAIIVNTIKDDSDTIFKVLQLGALGYIDKQSFELDFKEVFHCIENDGAYMTPKIARRVMNYFQHSRDSYEQLTKRETDIVNGILEGLSYKAIGDKYNIALDTVRTNIKRIYKKLNINSKGELFHMFRS